LVLVPEAYEPLQLVKGEDGRGLPFNIFVESICYHELASLQESVETIFDIRDLVGNRESLNG